MTAVYLTRCNIYVKVIRTALDDFGFEGGGGLEVRFFRNVSENQVIPSRTILKIDDFIGKGGLEFREIRGEVVDLALEFLYWGKFFLNCTKTVG